ncbi:MAG TPA: MFS transporter [Coxiellaceae bacterium]|nr:MAG: hypothetical protein A3E81_06830 [Gammaproteobacteria bacterium RIFCSPHIGHO2_12_FULL_36_30]HLB56460.1 MFS transporter [Coxiellaceae bacterium]
MHTNTKKQSLVFLIILIMLVSLSTFSTNLYIPALPSMVLLFHSNSTSLQQSLVSFTYGFAICMILSGILADTLGRKNTLLIGLFLYCVTSLLILFSQHLFSLILLRFLQGLGGCAGTVVARVIVRDQFDDKTAVGILALLSSGMAIAFIAAPLLGSMLVHFFSWKACFALMLIIGASLFAFVLFIFREPVTIIKKIDLSHVLLQYTRALQSKSFLIHTFAISITWTGFFLIVMEYPFFIMKQLKFSVVAFGFIFSVILFAYLAGARLARYFSHRGIMSERAALYGIMIMLLATFFGAVTLSEIQFHQSILLAIAGFFYLLGLGIQVPNSQFAAIPSAEKGSATMTSLFYFIEMIVVAALSGFFKSHFEMSGAVLWHVLFFLSLFLFFVYIAVVFYPPTLILEK